MKVRVPLSETESAYLAMVLDEHGARIRAADAARDARNNVLLTEKQIPSGVPVKYERLPGDTSMYLVYEDGQ